MEGPQWTGQPARPQPVSDGLVNRFLAGRIAAIQTALRRSASSARLDPFAKLSKAPAPARKARCFRGRQSVRVARIELRASARAVFRLEMALCRRASRTVQFPKPKYRCVDRRVPRVTAPATCKRLFPPFQCA